ncbi:hypothetical protein [Paenibacillus sp. RC67]|uniref:hypothetical protein n=1 Tax=Paenibacillus sp. RC67 TaxID=3039392 RepID=UPI0024AE000E|nr:hypothetical protein [Paenibacillus sp. RC67]
MSSRWPMNRPKPRFAKSFKLFSETKGSFTIEASFVLPLILLSTLSLLFLALYVYQTSSAFQNAGIAADRAAFIWDNSKKDAITGDYSIDKDDGLYWRIHSDSMSDLFRFLIPNAAAQISLPVSSSSNGTGPEGKMQKIGGTLSSGWSGRMRYVNSGFSREVTVDLEKPFRSPTFMMSKLQKNVSSEAAAQVVDPVESIRLIDLTRSFIQEIQGRIKPNAALKTMVEPKSLPEPGAVITNHESAANYLRTLVNGKEQALKVNGSTTRIVDALDANKVAHQAYYSFNESQLRKVQMPKDAELLRDGSQVTGVVWHFFKLSKQDKVKLSNGFRQELERQGIVVVIHE